MAESAATAAAESANRTMFRPVLIHTQTFRLEDITSQPAQYFSRKISLTKSLTGDVVDRRRPLAERMEDVVTRSPDRS